MCAEILKEEVKKVEVELYTGNQCRLSKNNAGSISSQTTLKTPY